jgi:hypothetical protein
MRKPIDSRTVAEGGYISFPDNTTYPHPDRVRSIERICRHGSPNEIIKNKMFIASILAAYGILVNHHTTVNFFKRKIYEIRDHVKREYDDDTNEQGGEG